MKKIKILSLFVCLAMLAIACHNEDDERGLQLRTVLVYIAGDNSLRSFATEDLAEMTVNFCIAEKLLERTKVIFRAFSFV